MTQQRTTEKPEDRERAMRLIMGDEDTDRHLAEFGSDQITMPLIWFMRLCRDEGLDADQTEAAWSAHVAIQPPGDEVETPMTVAEIVWQSIQDGTNQPRPHEPWTQYAEDAFRKHWVEYLTNAPTADELELRVMRTGAVALGHPDVAEMLGCDYELVGEMADAGRQRWDEYGEECQRIDGLILADWTRLGVTTAMTDEEKVELISSMRGVLAQRVLDVVELP